MTSTPVFSLQPHVKHISSNKKELTYYVQANPEEVYAILIIDSDLEQNKITFEISNYNRNYLQKDNIKLLLKCIFFLILDLSFNRIKILNFPINKKTWKECFKKLEEFVDKKIKIQKGPVFETDALRYIDFAIKRTRKNHYIPQGYLKNFSCTPSEKSKNKKILIYDKETGKLLIKNGSNLIKIENIAFSSHFYSIRFEQILAKFIEPSFFDVIPKVIQNQSFKGITYDEKVQLLKFIFSLNFRTRDTRSHFKEFTERMYKTMFLEYAKSRGVEIDETEISVDSKDILLRMKLEHIILDMINGKVKRFLEVYKTFMNMEWILLKASPSMKFITSDQPIILYSKSKSQTDMKVNLPGYFLTISKLKRGFLEQGIQIYFPLTPDYCLNIITKEHLSEQLTTQQINKQIIIKSYLYLFLSEDISNFIAEIIKNHPESINKDGNRVVIEKL